MFQFPIGPSSKGLFCFLSWRLPALSSPGLKSEGHRRRTELSFKRRRDGWVGPLAVRIDWSSPPIDFALAEQAGLRVSKPGLVL